MTQRIIHKFPLTTEQNNLPHGKPVLVANQDGMTPTVWIERDAAFNTGPGDTYVFIGTGHPVPVDWEHVGSSVCGPFVWHVYRREYNWS